MKKFLCTAEAVGYLEEVIEAENEDKANEIFQSHLENGAVPEKGDGSIENEQITEVT